MNIISIDPSLHSTGIYIKNNKEERIQYLNYDKDFNRLDILGFIYIDFIRILNYLNTFNKNIAIIEGYSFNSKNSRSITTQAEVGGIIRALIREKNIPIIEIEPSCWKSFALGSKNVRVKKGTKKLNEQYLKVVREIFKDAPLFRTTDEADAWMMAWTIQEIAKTKLPLKKEGLINMQNQLKQLEFIE